MKLSHDLNYYVEKINNGEKFSLARYGDGELNCMWNKGRKNSNGCIYSPELRSSLLDSFSHKKDPAFIYGLQRVLPQDEKLTLETWPDVVWHDTEIFSEAVANGELYPFIKALRSKQVMVIGNFSIRDVTRDILPNRWFYEVPPFNAYEERKRVIETIEWNNKFNKGWVYLFSCGMAANAFIGELHGKVDGWLLDVGHIWDAFAGSMSRCDLEGKSLEDIQKNLHEKN